MDLNEGVIMEHRKKLPTWPARKTQVLSDVCSSPGPSHETRASHKFIIENVQVKVVEEVDGRVVTSRANIVAARALRCLVEIMGDVSLRHVLLNIKAELELKIVDAPQQPNGAAVDASDCGFYLMNHIRDLIAGDQQARVG